VRLPFLPRPTREDLRSRSLQVIVRDYPETLERLREHGVSPHEHGDLTLGEHGDLVLGELEELADLLDDLVLATAWRPGDAAA
jgi:hypothetical protein